MQFSRWTSREHFASPTYRGTTMRRTFAYRIWARVFPGPSAKHLPALLHHKGPWPRVGLIIGPPHSGIAWRLHLRREHSRKEDNLHCRASDPEIARESLLGRIRWRAALLKKMGSRKAPNFTC